MTSFHRGSPSSDPRLSVVTAAMHCRLVFVTLAVFVGHDLASAQEHIPSTTTAAELWNPWTWFWPYAKATAEGYRDYYEKAQKATNELYQQVYKTNAFPWVTGNWGPTPQNNQGGNSQNGGQAGGNNQNGGQDNQGGNAGQTGQNDQNGGQDNPTGGQEKQPDSGTGAQVEGNVQEDGTADAQANANVEGEEVQV